MRGTFQVKVRLAPELYPRIARRQQRTAPFSEFRGGRPLLQLPMIFEEKSRQT